MRFSFLLFSACALFSYSSAVPIQNNDKTSIEETWQALEAGITQIYRREPPITALQHMNLYNLVHGYCTKSSDKLAVTKQGNRLLGEELYKRLNSYLEDYLEELFENAKGLDNEKLLMYYTTKWAEFRTSSDEIHKVFGYLNRHWVPREIADGRKDVHEVFQLTLIKWREHLLKRDLNARLTKTVLSLIEKERNGVEINFNAVRNYIDCYTLLGMGEIQFYKENFELAFVEETRKFYTDESLRTFNEKPILEYIRHAEKRFAEENDRVSRYLNPSTTPILMKTCEDAFIKLQMDAICNEFQGLLKSKEESSKDLRSLHSLVSRINGATTQLHDQFYKQVYAEGMSEIAKNAEKAKDDPKAFVEIVSEVRRSYYEIVKDSLSEEPGFVLALERALEKFINTNEITKITNNDDRIAEILAKYTDDLLKSKNANDNESELIDNLNKTIAIFKHTYNKEKFGKNYKNLLAKRLITDSSSSLDNESMTVAKLKAVGGPDLTGDLEQMINDMKSSNKIHNEYSKVRTEKENDFNVKLLKKGPWPKLGESAALTLPPQLEQEAKQFEDFFLKKRAGRTIQWLYNRCKGEMVFHSPSGTKYTLNVSIYQMAIFLQFNESEKLTMGEIRDRTGIPEAYLVKVMKILLKAKLFRSKDDGDKLTMASEIKRNLDFKA